MKQALASDPKYSKPQVASAGLDGTVRTWDPVDGSQIEQYGRLDPYDIAFPVGHKGPVKRVLMSPDSLRIISAGDDGKVKVWKTVAKHEKRVNYVSFTPDGTRAFTCSDDKTCRAFDVTTGTELTKIVGHTGGINMRWDSDVFGVEGLRVLGWRH